MPKKDDNNRRKNDERTNAEDLAERIRQHKLLKEREAEEEEEEKRNIRSQQDTEEDDENLQEEEEEEENRRRENKKQDEDDDEQDKEDEEKDDNDYDEEDKDGDDGNEKDNDDNIDKNEDHNKELNDKSDIDTDSKSASDVDTSKSTNDLDTSKSASNSNMSGSTDSGLGNINKRTAPGSTTTGGATGEAGGTVSGTAGSTSAGGTAAGSAVTGSTAAGGAAGGTAAGSASAAGGAAAGGASAGSAAAGGAVAGGATAAISALGIVLLIILIIIIVIGIIFFFITMPGMVVGKIGDAINDFRESAYTFFAGNDAAKTFVNREQVVDAAEYLNQMGYDLAGYGFLGEDESEKVEKKMTALFRDGVVASLKSWWSSTDEMSSKNLPLKDFNTKSIQERKKEDPSEDYQDVYLSKYSANDSDSEIRKNILMAKDADGNITFAKSKYIATYLSAENAIYLIRNDNTDIFNRVAKLIGVNDPSKGSGLMWFINPGDENLSKYISNASSDIEFRNIEGWFNVNKARIYKDSRTLVIKNEDDGWFTSSNYTYSLDGWASRYGVPIQLSLALHLSSLAPDFALQVAERGTTDTGVKMGLVENNNITTQAVLYLDLGNGKQYYQIQEDGDNYKLIKEDGSVAIFTGTDSNGEFSKSDPPDVLINAFEGKISKDELEDFVDELEDLDLDIEEFTKLEAIILAVENHWYQDLDFSGCYTYDTTGEKNTRYMLYTVEEDDEDIIKSVADKIYVKEISEDGTIKQIAEPKVINPGVWIKNLIDNEKYYKWDGVNKSETKSKINFADTAVDAIAMLEQIQGEDAQDIIRMFKELMASYNIYFEESEGTKLKKDLFAKVIRNYSGTLLTDGEDCVYKANIPPSQTGFDEDLIVQAPAKGKVTYRTEDTVCIEFTKKGEEFYKYTLLITGFKVNDDIPTEVKEGTELGKTIRQDLKLVLRDENGAIVKNKYVVNVGTDQNGGNSSIEANTDVRVAKSNPKYTKEQLESIFTKYNKGGIGKNLKKYASDFEKLQTKYGVDPLFAAAVTIQEQAAGTASSTCVRRNNWFSVKTADGKTWASYSSPKESIDQFGNMIANGGNYFTQGRYTIKDIGSIYCAPPEHWIEKVSQIMKQLENCK